jgi:hypothetical protein
MLPSYPLLVKFKEHVEGLPAIAKWIEAAAFEFLEKFQLILDKYSNSPLYTN